MSQNVKVSRRPKFGLRALKILRHLVENPYATQKELLALIRPEYTQYVFSDGTREPTSNRWGNSYLARRQGCNGYRASLVLRGVVAISNIKRGRCLTYVITPKGMAVLAGLV
jgi:hypothetical protein